MRGELYVFLHVIFLINDTASYDNVKLNTDSFVVQAAVVHTVSMLMN